MSWVSSLAIFFIIWWTALFAVLPFGVRNSAETGAKVGRATMRARRSSTGSAGSWW